MREAGDMSPSRNCACLLVGLVLLAVSLSACEGKASLAKSSPVPGDAVQQPPVSPTSTNTVPAATFVDPFTFCSVVGDAMRPDARYTGPQEPLAVVRGLEAADALCWGHAGPLR